MSALFLMTFFTAGAAMLCDLKMGRIPNALVLTAAVTGLFYQLIHAGPMGILHCLGGILLPLVLLIPLFRFRMMGAGDIKLLMGLGGMVGFPAVWRLVFWSFAAGGAAALMKMIFVTGFKERFRYLFSYLAQAGRSGQALPYRREGRRPENFPFAVSVFAAVILMFVTG